MRGGKGIDDDGTNSSESLFSSSEVSQRFFRERKEKLKVSVDKMFKEDAEMEVIEEAFNESYMTSRGNISSRGKEAEGHIKPKITIGKFGTS